MSGSKIADPQYKTCILVVSLENSNLICAYMTLDSKLAATAWKGDLGVITL